MEEQICKKKKRFIHILRKRTMYELTGICMLSVVFSMMQIIGLNFMNNDNWEYIFGSGDSFFKSILITISVIIIAIISLTLFFEFLDTNRVKQEKKEMSKWKGYAILTLCRIPYLVIFYPGISWGDTCRQMLMYWHIPTYVAGRLATDGENIIYSAHHPVFTTLIYGGFTEIGVKLGNAAIGVFLFSVMQILLSNWLFMYCFKVLREILIPNWLEKVLFFYVALSPLMSINAITMSSDIIFSYACVLTTCLLVKDYFSNHQWLDKWSNVLKMICAFLFMCLSKNQGFYISVFVCCLYLLFIRKNWKKWLVILVSVIIAFQGAYCGIFYSAMRIEKGGIQEMLSVPFQQTARYVRDYDKPISQEEHDIIDKVLVYDSISGNYTPNISDPVKNTFREDVSMEDLLAYFQVWGKEFFNAPNIYITAFLNGCYRYFYVGYVEKNPVRFEFYTAEKYLAGSFYEEKMKQFGIEEEDYAFLNIQNALVTSNARECIIKMIDVVKKIPILNFTFSIAWNYWLVIVACVYAICKKRPRMVLIYSVIWLSIIVSCISPVNGKTRYALPIIYSVPVAIGCLFGNREFENENISEKFVLEAD